MQSARLGDLLSPRLARHPYTLQQHPPLNTPTPHKHPLNNTYPLRPPGAECGKLADSALRSLLSVEGPQAAPLPALTSLRVFNSHHLSDETLRLVGGTGRVGRWVEGKRG